MKKLEKPGNRHENGVLDNVGKFAKYSVLVAGVALSGCGRWPAPATDVGISTEAAAPDARGDVMAAADSRHADSKPPKCQPVVTKCRLQAPPGSGTATVVDGDDGRTYKATTSTAVESGMVKVTLSFEPGLEKCSTKNDGVWNKCGWPVKCDSDNDYSYFRAAHRVMLPFFGEEYEIIDMWVDQPGGAPNSIILAKNRVSGILNIGESIQSGDYWIRLDEIGMGSCEMDQPAFLSFFDCNDEKLNPKPDELLVGRILYKTLPDGAKFMVHAVKIAPGYTFGARWADLDIIGSLMFLTNGLNPVLVSDGVNSASNTEWLKDWKVTIKTDGSGRLLLIELAAPDGSTLKSC